VPGGTLFSAHRAVVRILVLIAHNLLLVVVLLTLLSAGASAVRNCPICSEKRCQKNLHLAY
jgi:hypothetical protein